MSDENETRDRQPEGRRPAWQSGTPRGQERVVSYESDERYWTDYLRVALPVVGLLLMLGLLFWWANSIIGDEQGTQPTSTVASETNIAVAATNTPQPTNEAGLTPTEVVEQTTPSDPDGAEGTETTIGDPTEETGCESDFGNGDLVRVTENIRFRSDPNFDEENPPSIAEGAEVEISSDCFEVAENPADGTDVPFREVTVVTEGGDVENGERGWVSEEFLELIEE